MQTPIPVTSYTPEELDREYGTDTSAPVPTSRALQALSASAGGPFALVYEEAPRAAYLKEDDIERVGCNFIDATLQFLDWLNVPADVRDLVLAIAGLSGGNYSDFSEIPRSRIGQRMGLSGETVRQRVDALWEWQRNNGKSLVLIQEREYDPVKKRYTTTQYQPVVVWVAAEFMRELKACGLRPSSQQRAIGERDDHISEIANGIADRLTEKLPGVELSARREGKVKNVTPRQEKLSFIEGKEDRAMRAAAEYRDALRSAGYDPRDYSAEFAAKVQELFQKR